MKRDRRSAFDPRQYMLSADYEVYYYSDLHFRSVGTHSHDYYEFYFFVEGAVDMEIAGAAHPLRPGDVIVVPPGVPHRAVVRDGAVPYRRFVLWLSRDYCAKLRAQSPDYLYLPDGAERGGAYVHSFDALSFNALRGKLFTLLDELSADRYGRDARASLCIADLLLHVSRAVYERAHPHTRQEDRSHYEALAAYIEQHLDEDLTLDSVAAACYISKYYAAHLFQESTGLSVHQYITKKRLAAAADAIRAGTAAGAACAQAGWRDYTTFFRAFRKEYGMSPAAYRALHRRAN